MAVLEVLLLGGFQLRLDGESLAPLPSRAARSLFAHLLIHRGSPQPRERLAAAFWPDLPGARGRRRLSHTLWQIQDAFAEVPGGWDHLRATSDTIAVDGDAPCRIDVEDFEGELDRARELRDTLGAVDGIAVLQRAVERYRGDFLAGHYDEWVLVEQQRLAQRHLDALGDLVALTRSVGAYDEALVYARRLTHQDPLREDAHREVMRLCTLLGRTSDALRQYERCREVLAEELGTEPAAATRQLHQRILHERRRVEGAPPGPPASSFPQRLPLAGRNAERADGVAVLEDAQAGRGGLVLIEASAGHGKSRLLTELLDDARWRGAKTLLASGRGPQGSGPYAVVRQLLEPALTPLRVEQLRHRLDPVWLGLVAELLPPVARALPPALRPIAAVRPEEAAGRLRSALVRTLVAMASLDPLVVAVDDLQWADDASLELLAELSAEVGDASIALLLAYRGDEARRRGPVWRTVRDLDRRLRPVRLLLQPLAPADVTAVVRAAGLGRGAEAALAQRLHRETGGNPLFVVETLRSIAETVDDLDVDAGTLPLPATIRDLVRTRLASLSSDERALVEVAAVAGDGTGLDVLAEATELPRRTVVDAASTLVRRALLREAADGVSLSHEQLRRVTLDVLTEAARRALHRRVGTARERLEPEAVDRLAHHFAEAGDVRKAVHYLLAAGRAAAAVHAYAAAADYLHRAVVQQRQRPASVAARFDLLAELADVLDVLGDRAAQQSVVEELVALAQGSPAREVEALRRRALVRAQAGEHAAARRDAHRAVDTADTVGDDRRAAQACFALARVLAWGGERRASLPLLVRAVRTAGIDPSLALEIRTTLASVLRELGRYRAAAVELDAILDRAAQAGELRAEAHALGVLGTVRMETGDHADASTLYTRAIDGFSALGLPQGMAIAQVNLANVRYVQGRIGEALDAYEAAATTFATIDDRRGEATVRLNLGVVAADVLGDDARASRALVAALDHFAEAGDRAFEAACRETLARLALRAGDLSEARRQIGAALALDVADEDLRGQVQILLRAGEVELAAGDTAAAAAAVARAELLVGRAELADRRVEVRALEGRILLARGRPHAALEATRAAVDGLTGSVERPELVRLAHAEVLAALGHEAEAATVATRAADELGRLLVDLPPELRAQAEAVPEHRRILTAAARSPASRVRLVVAARGAPRGRPLRPAERLEVEVSLTTDVPLPDDPVEARRARLALVVADIEDQGGAPTTLDLAALLGVSEATVRRDLQALRAAGRPLTTRGSRTG
ncbi:BTAD domain-containing putative transcriptional regulator [Egicoccus halophilus]|uniref:SARP family transcriptional regulator n=1 Tax=Egicoccus halophilus TaxID=1670830 RepID=A0A8J3AE77_9ACTN|nr:BTAD domain-containing putative transcriptional regulator [Egicoccus halophilus]GGI05961.1 SARP family transcriptional regulator [Egicoccus halophilus]